MRPETMAVFPAAKSWSTSFSRLEAELASSFSAESSFSSGAFCLSSVLERRCDQKPASHTASQRSLEYPGLFCGEEFGCCKKGFRALCVVSQKPAQITLHDEVVRPGWQCPNGERSSSPPHNILLRARAVARCWQPLEQVCLKSWRQVLGDKYKLDVSGAGQNVHKSHQAPCPIQVGSGF